MNISLDFIRKTIVEYPDRPLPHEMAEALLHYVDVATPKITVLHGASDCCINYSRGVSCVLFVFRPDSESVTQQRQN